MNNDKIDEGNEHRQEPVGDGAPFPAWLDKDARLAAALVAAQAELTNPPFDATNPFFKNRYATLKAHLDTVRPILSKHGLAISQGIVGSGNQVGVITRLIHKDGGVLTDCIMSQLDKPTGQAIGALTTYLRRYGLAAICGVVGEEDDDGEADAKSRDKKPEKPLRPGMTPVTPKTGDTRTTTAAILAVEPMDKDGVTWWKLSTDAPSVHYTRSKAHAALAEAASKDEKKLKLVIEDKHNGKGWEVESVNEPDDIKW